MAITTQEEANAVQLLLDYYLRGTAEVPSHASAQAAWITLAEASRDQLGLGWRTPDVGNLFLPRGEDGPEPNVDIPDDCDACTDVNGECRFHRGALHGSEVSLDSAASALKVFARDPEQIGGVLDQDERNQRAEHEQQVRDQVSQIGGGLSEHEKGILNTPPADESSSRWPEGVTIVVDGDCAACEFPDLRYDPNTGETHCPNCWHVKH